MYEREINVHSGKRRSRRRRRRSAGPLLAVLVLLIAGGVLFFRAKGAQTGEEGKPSQVSAEVPSEPAPSDGTDFPEPEEPTYEPSEPSQEPEDGEGPESGGEAEGSGAPEEPVDPEEPQPDGDDWHLILVNPWNFIPEDYEVTLKSIGDGHKVDERCYDDLQAMLEACRAEGLSPIICSSYRTQEKQESLFQNKIQRLINQGYSEEEAPVEAAKVVAVPGTSEHQLGLALDIVDVSNQALDESQEGTPVQQWLMAHSWEYGFILRYPNEKSEITGIIYEPWHYRYVGREAAEEIYTQGVCLEEYLGRIDG